MGVLLKNNAFGTLATEINTTISTLILRSGNGGNFPNLSGTDYYYLTIVSGSSTPEIVKCVAKNGDVFTVVRGQEGTVPQTASAGARVELRVTAQSIRDAINDVVASDVGFTPYGNIAATNVQAAIEEEVSDLASSSGAQLIGYLASGASASTRTVQSKLNDIVSVKDFGAVGDGVVDDTAAFTAAMTASTAVYVPPGNYKITSTLTVPNNTSLIGAGRGTARLQKFFNGDMMTLGNYSNLSGLWLDGQGSTLSYTGQGVVINNGNGRQSITSCRITNFLNGACLYFFSQGGTQCSVVDLIASQTNGATGTGNFAIVIQDTGATESGAFPRKFSHIETNGFCSFFFGSSNNTYVSNSFLGDLFYSLYSRATLITNCRIANQTALLIQGNNHTIISSAISPQITIQTSSDNIALQGNSYNNLPIIDNSTNSRNLMDSWRIAYTPNWVYLVSAGSFSIGKVYTITFVGTTNFTLIGASSNTVGTTFTATGAGSGTGIARTSYTIGAAPGAGSTSGSYYRQGATTTVVAELNFGLNTSIGPGGNIGFLLPHPMTNDVQFVGGTVYMNRGGTVYEGFVQIPVQEPNLPAAYGYLLRDTSGSVTYNSPGTFTDGDFIRVSLTYPN